MGTAVQHPQGTKPIRLLLVDDHALFVGALASLVSTQPTLQIVGQAYDADGARAAALQLDHDLLVMDVSLPGASGLSLLRDLKRGPHRQPILVLTMHSHVDMMVEALHAGASGYAIKQQSFAELVEALTTTARGKQYVAPQLRHALDRGLSDFTPERGMLSALSSREREVLAQMLRGRTNAMVARILAISIKTVETHRSHIFRKLSVHGVSDLLRLAARHGLLPAAYE